MYIKWKIWKKNSLVKNLILKIVGKCSYPEALKVYIFFWIVFFSIFSRKDREFSKNEYLKFKKKKKKWILNFFYRFFLRFTFALFLGKRNLFEIYDFQKWSKMFPYRLFWFYFSINGWKCRPNCKASKTLWHVYWGD